MPRFFLSLSYVLTLAACTTFEKVDDAGARDAGLGDSAVDGVFADGEPMMDSGLDVLPEVDAGPECVDFSHEGSLTPEFVPEITSYTLALPFAQVRTRITHQDAEGRDCGAALTDPDGIVRFFEDGSFAPVEGASLVYGDYEFTLAIDRPVFNNVWVYDTQAESAFGSILSADGNTLAVGAPNDSRAQRGINTEPMVVSGPPEDAHLRTGAVHIFDVDEGFDRLAFIKSDEEPFQYARFGAHLHYRDGHLAVSAPGYFVSDTEYGRAHIYELASWQSLGIIERPLSGGRLLYAYTTDGFVYLPVPRRGSGDGVGGRVNAYRRQAMSWAPTVEIVSPRPPTDDRFGSRMELAGHVMLIHEGVITAPSSQLHLYRWTGMSWESQSELEISDSYFLFATDGSYAVVTSALETRLFSIEADSFELIATMDVGVDYFDGRFGGSVAVRDGRVAVGVSHRGFSGEGSVATGVLSWDGEVLSLRRDDTPNPLPDGGFGSAVALTESAGLVVGAPLQSVPGLFGHGGIFLFE